jgi:type II secretory pathway pseudopilin PulG
MSHLWVYLVAGLTSVLAFFGLYRASRKQIEATVYRERLENIVSRLKQAVLDRVQTIEQNGQEAIHQTDSRAQQEVVNAANPVVNRWNKSGKSVPRKPPRLPAKVNGSGDGRSEDVAASTALAGRTAAGILADKGKRRPS